MPTYRAKPGQEDRYGEMTGAITVNMILCMPVVTVWGIFVGPWLLESMWANLAVALALAVALPIACLPLSQRLWACVSEYMERDPFTRK